MDESSFWSERLRPKLLAWYPGIFLERVENVVSVGTPDVHYANLEPLLTGWIELKYRNATPVRGSTIVLGQHGLRKEQIAWWRYYLHCGGKGWIAVGVGRTTWMLPASDWLVRNLNDWTWDELQTYAPMAHRPLGAT